MLDARLGPLRKSSYGCSSTSTSTRSYASATLHNPTLILFAVYRTRSVGGPFSLPPLVATPYYRELYYTYEKWGFYTLAIRLSFASNITRNFAMSQKIIFFSSTYIASTLLLLLLLYQIISGILRTSIFMKFKVIELASSSDKLFEYNVLSIKCTIFTREQPRDVSDFVVEKTSYTSNRDPQEFERVREG